MTDLCRLIFWTLVVLRQQINVFGAPLREGSSLVFLIG
jgi:hypothetical protein